MRINIVQMNYDPTDIEKLKTVLSDLEGITCFPECFALGRSGVETLQYLNRVSDEKDGENRYTAANRKASGYAE
jgi:hypothetical protein